MILGKMQERMLLRKQTITDTSKVTYTVDGNADIKVTVEDGIFEQLKNELFTEELESDVEKKVIVKVDVVPVEDMDDASQAKFDSYLEAYNAELEDGETVTQALIFDISVIKSFAGLVVISKKKLSR